MIPFRVFIQKPISKRDEEAHRQQKIKQILFPNQFFILLLLSKLTLNRSLLWYMYVSAFLIWHFAFIPVLLSPSLSIVNVDSRTSCYFGCCSRLLATLGHAVYELFSFSINIVCVYWNFSSASFWLGTTRQLIYDQFFERFLSKLIFLVSHRF
jgi:hypothetical protein